MLKKQQWMCDLTCGSFREAIVCQQRQKETDFLLPVLKSCDVSIAGPVMRTRCY